MRLLETRGLITWLYYVDLGKAIDFYDKIMGFQLVVDQGWAKIFIVREGAYVGLVDQSQGFHRAGPAKPVIVCLNVLDCDAWYKHFKEKGVQTLSEPRVSERLRIKAFMLRDPEGYVIEIQESLPGALSI